MLKKNSIVNSIDCPRKMPGKRRGRPWIFLRCRGRPWIFFPAVPITSYYCYICVRHIVLIIVIVAAYVHFRRQ